ncbi:sensor histidine kinase [Costertonia aggregata]|uniref:Histidine kinase n=1 Tax=Costertonia aggregata TaxID=343403 RepID=A0A7H9ARH3_9FLAO|nr:histidine kinase [Costertonia aggregata]QLG46019.1 histidine kinase [Costertonia aggregata]
MDSFFKKYRWGLAFWAVNFSGWAGISFIAYAFTPSFDGYKDSNHFLISILATFVIGMLVTGILRAYLKHFKLDNFGTKDLFKILSAITIISLLYFGLTYGSGYVIGYFEDEKIEIPDMYKEYSTGLVIFNSFLIMIGWSIFYMAVKVTAKLNAERVERAELNATIRQAQLNTLKGQINPHFMFNSLNNIRGLMLEDVERSRDMLTKLSEMLRYSLTKNDVNAIALEDELEMVENYISLSKIQFEDRLHFVKKISGETLTIPIPPMIIQLLVENAAKHGIGNLKDGGEILVETQTEGDELLITVTNTGKLQISKNSTQLGLKNIRQRLKLLYGNKANFSLNEIGKAVVAQIKIPLA